MAKNEIWNGLKPLEPNAVERHKIEQLLEYNPKLDYLMALLLVKSSDEDLQKIINEGNNVNLQPMSSTIIKDAVYLDNEGL